MTIAPHHDFRRLWIEAATPGDTMRALSNLEQAWSTLTESIGDLPFLNSEELFEPLIEFDQFQLPINEVLQRVVARQAFSEETEQPKTRPFVSSRPFETDRGKLNPVSPLESLTARQPSHFSSASDEVPIGHTEEQTVAVRRPEKVNITRSHAPERATRGGPFPPPVDDDVKPRMGDLDAASRISTAPHFAAESRPQLREEPARDRLASPETYTRRAAARDIAPLKSPDEGSPPTAADQLVNKSSFAPALRGEESARRREERRVVASAASISAPPEPADSTTPRRDVFDRVLGPAVERLSEENRRRRQKFERAPISSIENAPAENDLPLPDHRRRWRDARSSALQRLVTRASADIIRTDEPNRSTVDDEFASFTRANSADDSETDQFALQLSTLLRREMRHHGINLAALEQ